MKKLSTVTVLLIFSLLISNANYAQTDIGFKGIGGKLGYVSPEDPIESTIGFGAVFNLGQIISSVKLDAGIDYWSKKYESGTTYLGTWETTLSEITIYALGKYYIPLSNSPVKPYGGAGLGFVIGKASIDTPLGSHSESDTDFGIRLVGGADYEFSPNLKVFAEVAYHTNGTDFFGIFAGVMFSTGK